MVCPCNGRTCTRWQASRPAPAKRSTVAFSGDGFRPQDRRALRQRLGTDVRLTAKRKGRGLLSISYYSNDDLARLLELILGEPFDG